MRKAGQHASTCRNGLLLTVWSHGSNVWAEVTVAFTDLNKRKKEIGFFSIWMSKKSLFQMSGSVEFSLG